MIESTQNELNQLQDGENIAPSLLDVESTGLGIHAQAIEIGVTDSKGNVLLDVRLLPTVPIEEGAAAVHGISLEMLGGAVQWPVFA